MASSVANDTDRQLGQRFFRALSDHDLANWRPATERGMFGWSGVVDCANVSAANREMRRRSKIAGMADPYEWLTAIALATTPARNTSQIGEG